MIPLHLEIALGEIGVEEWPGAEHNPQVLGYLASTTLGNWGRSRDETPWCSAFINDCINRAHGGGAGTNNALARSWLRWGDKVEPEIGCVCVIKRRRHGSDRRTGSRGGYHVGLFMDRTRGGVVLLSGNTSNRVGIDFFSSRKWDVLAYRA